MVFWYVRKYGSRWSSPRRVWSAPYLNVYSISSHEWTPSLCCWHVLTSCSPEVPCHYAETMALLRDHATARVPMPTSGIRGNTLVLWRCIRWGPWESVGTVAVITLRWICPMHSKSAFIGEDKWPRLSSILVCAKYTKNWVSWKYLGQNNSIDT